jgi:hypothetical protein
VPSRSGVPFARCRCATTSAQAVAEQPAHRQLLLFHDRHLDAPRACRRRDLASDETATEDNHSFRRLEPRASSPRVVGDGVALLEHDGARIEVDADGRLGEPQLEVELPQLVRRAQHGALRIDPAEQHVLGERRPVVRMRPFFPD